VDREKRVKIFFFADAIVIGVFLLILIVLLKIKLFNKFIFYDLFVSTIALQLILETILEYSPNLKFMNNHKTIKNKSIIIIVILCLWTIVIYFL